MNLKHLLSGALILLSACTTQQTKDYLATIQPAIQEAAHLTVTIVLTKQPDSRPKVELALKDLKYLSSQDKISVDQIWFIINQLDIKALQSNDAILYYSAGKLALTFLVNQKYTEIQTNEELHKTVTSLIIGITQALDEVPVGSNITGQPVIIVNP